MGAQDNLTNVLAVVLGVTIGAGRADFVALARALAGMAEWAPRWAACTTRRAPKQQLADQGNGHTAPDASRQVLSGVVTAVSSLLAGLVPLAPVTCLPVCIAGDRGDDGLVALRTVCAGLNHPPRRRWDVAD